MFFKHRNKALTMIIYIDLADIAPNMCAQYDCCTGYVQQQ